VAATLAGAASCPELGSAAAGLPRELLSLLGARWDVAGLVFIAPSAGTLRRVLIAPGRRRARPGGGSVAARALRL
jgi:hypothetical protein